MAYHAVTRGGNRLPVNQSEDRGPRSRLSPGPPQANAGNPVPELRRQVHRVLRLHRDNVETVEVAECGICGEEAHKKDIFKRCRIRLIPEITARDNDVGCLRRS